jgi:hypothetical protein
MMKRKIALAAALGCLALATNANASILLDFDGLSGPVSAASGEYALFVWGGDWTAGGDVATAPGGSTIALASGGTFTFEGADFSSANDLTITATLGGVQVATTTIAGGAWTSSAGFGNVAMDKLTITTTGQFQMDNFNDNIVVPEPSTVVAGILLLLPFGVSTVRMFRRN